MFKRPIFAAILATAIPMSAHAGQFNYNYIELGLDKAKYGQGDASYGRGESINGDGNLSGAFGFADHFYVSGAYRKADFHVEGDILGMNFRAEEDFTYWALNFGYHLSVSENNDFIAEIGRESYSNDTQLFLNDSSFGGGKYTNKNLQAAAGLRTSFGNRLETLAIRDVFGKHANDLLVSSQKSMIGHAMGGAGAIEAVVTVLTLAHGVATPTINLQTPDPDCDLDYVPHEARKKPIRAAMSNSFGFGGHDSAIIFAQPNGL